MTATASYHFPLVHFSVAQLPGQDPVYFLIVRDHAASSGGPSAVAQIGRDDALLLRSQILRAVGTVEGWTASAPPSAGREVRLRDGRRAIVACEWRGQLIGATIDDDGDVWPRNWSLDGRYIAPEEDHDHDIVDGLDA